LKYKKLEQELLKLRENVKLELERFTEQNVGVKLSDLNRHRLQIEARHKHNHQVWNLEPVIIFFDITKNYILI